ncbi:hypothetical protein Cni_G14104 [Canna indica]|uniref:Uncharacterized protein n=1 Tax=Canna indica TaxID=4628 RepID=A0AAQ3QAC8_9LILI|nr:hypothetical protein Cni_G14104 [Canna indica]
MDPHRAVELVDENTICVAAILGSTLKGEFEDVKLLNDLLTEKNKETRSSGGARRTCLKSSSSTSTISTPINP